MSETPTWARLHDERWPWCQRHDTHEHEDRVDGTYVNGEKAGPMWGLRKTEAAR